MVQENSVLTFKFAYNALSNQTPPTPEKLQGKHAGTFFINPLKQNLRIALQEKTSRQKSKFGGKRSRKLEQEHNAALPRGPLTEHSPESGSASPTGLEEAVGAAAGARPTGTPAGSSQAQLPD